jgi:hypothetical protein
MRAHPGSKTAAATGFQNRRLAPLFEGVATPSVYAPAMLSGLLLLKKLSLTVSVPKL